MEENTHNRILIGADVQPRVNKHGLIIETHRGYDDRKRRYQENARWSEGMPGYEPFENSEEAGVPLFVTHLQIVATDESINATVTMPVSALDLDGLDWKIAEGNMRTTLFGKTYELAEVAG